MFDAFIIRAAVGGIGVALVAGPLGCFVVWRRMAYFGDTLAHAGLTGVALGLVLGTHPTIGIVFTGVAIALLLLALQRQQRVPTDTLLGILSHSALAIGLIAISFMETVRVDLMGYLFGDILAVTVVDIAWIYGSATVLLAVLVFIWKPLIAMTVDEDLAVAEGVNGIRTQLIFTVLIALTVALAMKIVGVLLVTALLIIPAAAARRFAFSPEGMAIGAAILGGVAVLSGLFASLQWDTPSGPSVVAAAAFLFALSLMAGATVKDSGR
jgi:zinc transport system permease protein